MNNIERVIFALFLFLCLFLTFNRHSKSTYSDYHSVIWSDKAGYYIYLPATFIYKWNASKFDNQIIIKTGNGFTIENNSFKTKYPPGVSILNTPFYLFGQLIAETLYENPNGFEPVFHWSIQIASIFYVTLGMLLLYLAFPNHNKALRAYILLTIFIGTNLYFYTVDQAGMSHGYSFFLFASLIYTFETKRHFAILLIPLLFTLVMLVRPVNFLFLIILFIHYKPYRYYHQLLSFKVSLLPLFLLSLPFVHNYFTFGSIISGGYQNEGFTNISSPKLLEVLISTNNGLLLYSPVVIIFILASIIIMIKKKEYTYILCYILVWIVYASWWSWHLGCAFGHRGFIEYYSYSFAPILFLFQKLSQKTAQKWAIYIFSFLSIIYSLKMSYTLDNCWYYDTWDYLKFWNLVIAPTN